MKKFVGVVSLCLLFVSSSVGAYAQNSESVLTQVDLSQFIYSYGTVLKVAEKTITLQEYDYDSDVEKEIVYQIVDDTKLEGLKAVGELVVEDVVEVYYLEQDGQRVAKIIHREVITDDVGLEEPAQL